MEQGTEEWLAARAGKMTGSRFAAIVGTGKTHDDLLRDLAWERYTGRCVESYTTPAMQRGTDLEPEARNWYAFVSGLPVREEGFIVHPTHPFIGISPDGLTGDEGLIEIKCPGHRAHLETLDRRKVPSQYRWQVQGQLWITGRAWLDFVSYHPDHDGVVVRVYPSEKDHAELEAACIAANTEVERLLALLTEKEKAA